MRNRVIKRPLTKLLLVLNVIFKVAYNVQRLSEVVAFIELHLSLCSIV
jgi:hypothetical protein